MMKAVSSVLLISFFLNNQSELVPQIDSFGGLFFFKQLSKCCCFFPAFLSQLSNMETRNIDSARVAMDPDRLEQHIKRAEELIQSDTKEVPPFWINKYKNEAARNWDIFYKRNTTKFFKDRHWTDREFDELACHPDQGKVGEHYHPKKRVNSPLQLVTLPGSRLRRGQFCVSCPGRKSQPLHLCL